MHEEKKSIFSLARAHRLEFAALLFILSISLVFRWLNARSVPYGLEQDEIQAVATALFEETGVAGADQGVWSAFVMNAHKFPVSVFLKQIAFKLFGYDLLAPRKMLALCSVVSLFFFYLVLRETISAAASLVILLLYSLSTYKLMFSAIPLQHGFADFFLYPGCLLLFLCLRRLRVNRVFAAAFLALGSGTCVLLCVFTYNLAYLMPLVFATTAVVYCVMNRIRFATSLIVLFLFLAPFLVYSKKLTGDFIEERERGSYALERSAVDANEKTVDLGQVLNNAQSVGRLIVLHMDYEFSDMILRTDSSLIDPVAAALILLGLVSASIQPKKNYFVLIWFFIGFLPFHVFLGLLLPRMWFLSFGLLYLLAAIGTDTAIQIVSKWKHPYARIIALCAGCMLAGFALQRNISTFYTSAVKNFTFREDFREVWEIAKHRRRVLPDQVLFITQDENFDCTRTLAAFVWVSDHKDQAGSLNGSGNHAMSVFSQNDLQPALEVLPRKKCLIVENPVLSDLEKQIPPGVHLSLLNTGCYYTEFLITRDKL